MHLQCHQDKGQALCNCITELTCILGSRQANQIGLQPLCSWVNEQVNSCDVARSSPTMLDLVAILLEMVVIFLVSLLFRKPCNWKLFNSKWSPVIELEWFSL